MKDYLVIIRRNFASPIVLAILLLAMALVYVRNIAMPGLYHLSLWSIR